MIAKIYPALELKLDWRYYFPKYRQFRVLLNATETYFAIVLNVRRSTKTWRTATKLEIGEILFKKFANPASSSISKGHFWPLLACSSLCAYLHFDTFYVETFFMLHQRAIFFMWGEGRTLAITAHSKVELKLDWQYFVFKISPMCRLPGPNRRIVLPKKKKN